MNRVASLLVAAALGGIVVGGIVWLTRPAAPVAPMPASRTAVPAPDTTAAASPATQSISVANTSAPPWAEDTAAGGSVQPNLGSAISLSSQDRNKASQRAALRKRIQKLTTGGRHPTPAEMTRVLDDMERVEGQSVVAGVDLDALRQNLVNVQKLQRISLELQVETKKPGGGDKQKVQALLEQLRQIQSNMNYNIAKGPPAVPRQ